MSWSFDLLDRGLVPDALIRVGIRRLLRVRLRELEAGTVEERSERFRKFLAELDASPVAENVRDANEQHYELPPEFFELCLGKRLKYSCALYGDGVAGLDEAEERMLDLYLERARLEDGQRILELGCGWGSLTLWMAEKLPGARITGVSNSRDQRAFIEARARERGLGNVEILTRDMNDFEPEVGVFDRVVSIEMFEHMKNYRRLMAMVGRALRPEGRLFVHIFTHARYAYPFETAGEDDWMGRYFFTGGNMPSDDLLLHFQDDLAIEDHWRVSGTHYEKTSEDWLRNMDRNAARVKEILRDHYGAEEAGVWWVRWRVFFMACAELWGFDEGRQWFVSHYLFRRRGGSEGA